MQAAEVLKRAPEAPGGGGGGAPPAEPYSAPGYTIVVDSRPGENALFQHLLNATEGAGGGAPTRKQLDIGDILIETEHCTIMLERKTIPDFSSSLRDQRYRNQKARMLAEREKASKPFFIAYLIECVCVPKFLGMTAKTSNKSIFAALFKSALRDNIPPMYVSSSQDAALSIVYLAEAAAKDGFNAETKLAALKDGGYASLVTSSNKRKNEENGTNQFSIMLSTICGVSAVKASAIVKHYPCASAMVQACKDGNANTFADIRVDEKSRIGPVLSAKLYDLFK